MLHLVKKCMQQTSWNYDNSMNATLVMPPIDLPEGNSYLQFKQWHNFEQSSSGRAWDYGHVFISTDQVEWTQLLMIQGASNGWIDAEVDLSRICWTTSLHWIQCIF